MKHIERNTSLRTGPLAVLAACALLAAGCSPKKDDTSAGFATPEDAAKALVAALQKNDLDAAKQLLGPDSAKLLSSGDAVSDQSDRNEFLTAYAAKSSVTVDGDTATLVVGPNDWSLPIPIVKRDGKWVFDGAQGVKEMIYRRVGGNELGAIDVMYGYVAAQNDYASAGRDGDAAGVYAIKLMSDPGLHNGLYWPTAEGEPPSPAGPFVANAAEEGYKASLTDTQGYHGYYYRMLYAQGPNANGGAKEYFKDGALTEGFAAIAWPADYGASGVMTFIVNQDGVVFQKDLGADTAKTVETIRTFDPDDSWTAIVPEGAADAAAPPDGSAVPPSAEPAES